MDATTMNDSICLFSTDGENWDEQHDQTSKISWEPDSRVKKIVIGKEPNRSEKNEEADLLAITLPANLTEIYPNLTHLYLWNCDLDSMPELPPNLEVLDLRGCAILQQLSFTGNRLESLILDGCQTLSKLDVNCQALTELSLMQCSGFNKDQLNQTLSNASQLRSLHIGNMNELARIRRLPNSLKDLRIHHCPKLKQFPAAWPNNLARLEIVSCDSVAALADFPDSLDVVDLKFCTGLKALPEKRGNPRTLYLYGSGTRKPPASVRGKDADENVARNTASYFADLEKFGEGKVERCKVLVLGNGSAGKTSLSLLLTGEDPKQADEIGSTHAIQFWPWEVEAFIDDKTEKLPTHIWDFGGQEIYHNTHRLFMEVGSIFLLVWNPDQDGKQPETNKVGYDDVWHSLKYWLELIKESCPHAPDVAIVCSHHSESTEELDKRWKREVPDDFPGNINCYYVDSKEGNGQVQDLIDHLGDSARTLVEHQGSVVPSYWEIAYELVEELLANSTNQVTRDSFKSSLLDRINHAVATAPNRFPKLAEIESFQITEDQLNQTLEFLTNTGLVFWNPSLFEQRVIIGQEWALKALYAILDRRDPGEKIERITFTTLKERKGVFTLSDLNKLEWGRLKIHAEEQPLLLSYMVECGLIFQLRKAEDAWREEDLYVSVSHLPTVKDSGFVNKFDDKKVDINHTTTKFEIDLLFPLRWRRLLADAGRTFGKRASYASDGLLWNLEDGSVVLLHVMMWPRNGEPGQLNLEISAVNKEQKEKIQAEVEELVATHLFSAKNQTESRTPMTQIRDQAVETVNVFISYAWNPKDKELPGDYETPVDLIEERLRDLNSSNVRFELIRDKNEIKPGVNIREFMTSASKSPRIIVIHSDKWVRSPYCMNELSIALHECLMKARQPSKVFIPVQHINSDLSDRDPENPHSLTAAINYWDNYSGKVSTITEFQKPEDLRSAARESIKSFAELFQQDQFNIKLNDDNSEKVIDAVINRLVVPYKDKNDE